MPRIKRPPSARGGPQSNSRGGRAASSLETTFVPFAGTSVARGQNGFSLQDEARNTERHALAWDSDQRLRFSKVKFVSAASFDTEPESDKYPDHALASMSLESPVPVIAPSPPWEKPSREVVMGGEATEVLAGEESGDFNPFLMNSLAHGFMVDTLGEPLHTGLPPPQLRSVSPSPSNSSEEIILFRGRNNVAKLRNPKARINQIDGKIRIVEDRIQKQQSLLEQAVRSREPSIPNRNQVADDITATPAALAYFEPILPRREGRSSRRGRPNRRKIKQEEEDALMTDYLLNVTEDDNNILRNMSFGQRELGGACDLAWQDETEVASGHFQASKRHPEADWELSDICDFDNMSTSDGVMGEVHAIFSKRERDSGLQYLVVWQGQTVDEARWVPVSTLTSITALAHINDFEVGGKLVAKFQDNLSDVTTDSEDIDDDIGGDDGDEEDLVQKNMGSMSDEQIARLLAKQEELGMGSNELLLFENATDDDTPFAPKETFDPLLFLGSNRVKRSRLNSRGMKRPRREFPAAPALTDAYDGFDVMDFERHSLKKKPKGRKGKLILDLSDSELEASIQSALSNDRIKKKERKLERVELRTRGLLGSKNSKPDLKEKYKEGMGFHAVKEEIKIFLMGGNTTLALPPMDKADRKIVHEIANAFNLKSKSAGKGQTRYPILYRTSRTSAYVERTFAAVEARLTRRFLPRMDVSGGKRPTSKHTGGGFNNAAVTYRDGDIVGGSAPELGVDNKGRAMLEKMGWSMGTALGAINNKGILQPVSHVVKTTKAGLG